MLQKTFLFKVVLYLLFIFLVIFQISFLNSANFFMLYFNTVFILLFIIIFIWSPQHFLLYLLSAAFIFELHSQFSFGVYLLTYAFTFFIIYLLLKSVLTHYTTISMLSLMTLSTILFNLSLFILTWLLQKIQLNNYIFSFEIKTIVFQLLINLGVLIILTQIFKLTRKQFWLDYER